MSRSQGVGPPGGRTVVLNFHGIGRPARALEPGEARFWIGRDVYRRILDAVLAGAGEGREIAITFDDGNASDIEIGAPELAARGLRATFFALAGRLGEPGSLAAADLRALRLAGHAIGTHGFDHVDWRKLDGPGATREFATARAVLAEAAGGPITEAAVPFGLYNAGVLRALASHGLTAIHTSDRGVIRGRPWIRPRNCVRADMDEDAIAAILADRQGALARVRRALGVARKRLL